MEPIWLAHGGCFCIRLLIEVPPPQFRSFGIKYLAIVFARSLRNKDLAVKYFSVNDLGAILADLARRYPKHPQCRRIDLSSSWRRGGLILMHQFRRTSPTAASALWRL